MQKPEFVFFPDGTISGSCVLNGLKYIVLIEREYDLLNITLSSQKNAGLEIIYCTDASNPTLRNTSHELLGNQTIEISPTHFTDLNIIKEAMGMMSYIPDFA